MIGQVVSATLGAIVGVLFSIMFFKSGNGYAALFSLAFMIVMLISIPFIIM